jgi:DNA-binding NarL/FixJ family response regulator
VITVALVDDQSLVRAGFHALLDAEEEITVVAQVADGESAVALARHHRPDVVLMDIRMPGVEGAAGRRPDHRRPAAARHPRGRADHL